MLVLRKLAVLATSRMLPHEATIYVETGRNERYQTEYAVYVLKRVYCTGGTSYQGGTPSDPLTVYMFDISTKGIGTLKPEGNGKQFIVPYVSSSPKPPKDARTIRAVHRRRTGSPRMWHWKVIAE